MFNKIILVGNLTRTPGLHVTPGGTSIATIGLAVNSKYKSGDEMKEEVLFIDCVVFGKQAENVTKYLEKGKRVLVEGRLQERKWETKEGEKRSKMEVLVNDVKFLSPPSTGTQPATPPDEITDIEPF